MRYRDFFSKIVIGITTVGALLLVVISAPRQLYAVGSPLDIMPSGLPSVTTPFGGQIVASLSCDTAATCINPICLLVSCILQVPFSLQVFNNYALASGVDGFDVLREDVLEPKEKEFCSPFCNALGPVIAVACPYFCSVLPGLQEANISPVGAAVEVIKQTVPGGFAPAIALTLFPVQNPIPACQNFGFITGSGLGQGLFFIPNPYISGTKGTPLEGIVGDSCRGNYFSPFPYIKGGL